MASCLSPTSVPFLACGDSGWPRCHLAAQCHVWAAAGWGPLPSPGLLLLHGGAPMGLGCGPGWGEAEEGWGACRWLKHTSGLKERCWGEVLCVWSRDLRKPVYSGGGGGSWPAAQECLCHDGSGGEEECTPQSQHCRSRARAEMAAISSYLF